jgi:hypothetical protein
MDVDAIMAKTNAGCANHIKKSIYKQTNKDFNEQIRYAVN